ncbi:MAG: DUF459 domain-containing protein [Myxococcota bacterium]
MSPVESHHPSRAEPKPASLEKAATDRTTPDARPQPGDEQDATGEAVGAGPRVLVIGDSMVVTELGRDLSRIMEAELRATVYRRGKSSTGLARPDFFDWFAEAKALTARFEPDLVVVIVGGNDGQDLLNLDGAGRIRWRSGDWASAYSDRVHAFLDAMSASGRRFVWIELPAMEHRRLEGKLKLIREVQAHAVSVRQDVLTHVATAPCFYDSEGHLLTRIPSGAKQGRRIRQEDGIHFSLFGARYVSSCIAPSLLEAVRQEGVGPSNAENAQRG